METTLQARLEQIVTSSLPREVKDNEINYLKSAQPEAVQAEINAWVAQYFSCYVREKTPSKALDDIRAGLCIPFSLDEAKEALDKAYVAFAGSLNDPEEDAKRRDEEVKQSTADIALALETPEEKKALYDYSKGRLEAAIANREQKDSDNNATWILFWSSVLGLARIPVLPTFKGNFQPQTAAHTVTPERLTSDELAKRRLVLGGAQILQSLPPYDKWINGLIESGDGGTETGDMGANLSLGATVFGELPAAVTRHETLAANVSYRGQKMSGPLQLFTTSADAATLFSTGYRHSYQGVRISVNEELCSHPDASDANQWRDSPIIKDWKKAHPGEPVPVEIIRQARDAADHQPECDEIVTASANPSDMFEAYYDPTAIGIATHGLVSDVIANQGLVRG
ncbi:MAG: hypothetical protein Q7T11_07825 [Deltaproteobacteria bacterium]|nr:hypothetical protein [Deltaproteobacteria bacterium]